MKTEEELTQYIRELAVIEWSYKTRLADTIKIDSDTVNYISFYVFKRNSPYKFFDWMQARGYLMNHYERGFHKWMFTKELSFKVPTPSVSDCLGNIPEAKKMKVVKCASCGLEMWKNQEIYFYKCKCGREDII